MVGNYVANYRRLEELAYRGTVMCDAWARAKITNEKFRSLVKVFEKACEQDKRECFKHGETYPPRMIHLGPGPHIDPDNWPSDATFETEPLQMLAPGRLLEWFEEASLRRFWIAFNQMNRVEVSIEAIKCAVRSMRVKKETQTDDETVRIQYLRRFMRPDNSLGM